MKGREWAERNAPLLLAGVVLLLLVVVIRSFRLPETARTMLSNLMLKTDNARIRY